MSNFEFIDADKADYPITMLCRVLDVSRSGYCRWKSAPPSERPTEEARLKPGIATNSTEDHRPRVHAELVDRGFEVGRQRVARLMREMGLYALLEHRFQRPTDAAHLLGFAPDSVKRNFEPDEPKCVWASGMTYVWTGRGWIYLAVVINLCNRKVVGWSMADHMRTYLVLEALDRALATRETDGKLVHLSGRGRQYDSHALRDRLDAGGIACCMGATGCSFDNACAEGFLATIKTELIHRGLCRELAAARVDITKYIRLFYNLRRRHSAPGYVSPSAFGVAHVQHQPAAALAA